MWVIFLPHRIKVKINLFSFLIHLCQVTITKFYCILLTPIKFLCLKKNACWGKKKTKTKKGGRGGEITFSHINSLCPGEDVFLLAIHEMSPALGTGRYHGQDVRHVEKGLLIWCLVLLGWPFNQSLLIKGLFLGLKFSYFFRYLFKHTVYITIYTLILVVFKQDCWNKSYA